MNNKAMIAIGVILLAFLGFAFFQNQKSQEPSADGIQTKLENASDCTTQKLLYTGVVKVKKGKIPLITKSEFMMKYTAIVRAGFDMKDVDLDITNTKIVVKIPEIVIQDVSIDPESIEYYNTSLTLFKPDGKEAAREALIAAKKDAKKNAKSSGLIEAAEGNAETLIQGILEDSLDGRTLIIKHK